VFSAIALFGIVAQVARRMKKVQRLNIRVRF